MLSPSHSCDKSECAWAWQSAHGHGRGVFDIQHMLKEISNQRAGESLARNNLQELVSSLGGENILWF